MSFCATQLTQATQHPQPIYSDNKTLLKQQINDFLCQEHRKSKESAEKRAMCLWHQGIDIKGVDIKGVEKAKEAEEAKKAKEADREEGELSDDDEESPASDLMSCLPINRKPKIIIDQTYGNSSVLQSTLLEQMPFVWTDTDHLIHSRIVDIISDEYDVQLSKIKQLKRDIYNLWKERENISLLYAISALFFKLLPLRFCKSIKHEINFTLRHGMNLLIGRMFKDFNATSQQLTVQPDYSRRDINKFKEICFKASEKPECLQRLDIEEKCKLVILLEHFYQTDPAGNKYARVILKLFPYDTLIANNTEIKKCKGKLLSHSFLARCIWLKTAWNSIDIKHNKKVIIRKEQELENYWLSKQSETNWLSKQSKNNCIEHYLNLKLLVLNHVILNRYDFSTNFKEMINEMDDCLLLLESEFTAIDQRDSDFKSKTKLNILQIKLELCIIDENIKLANVTKQKLSKAYTSTNKLNELYIRLKHLESSDKSNSGSCKIKISHQSRTSRLKATPYSKP